MVTPDDGHGLVDARRVHYFWLDDALFDHYGQTLGVYGIAIYAYLARRAKAQKSFPSIRRIAKDLCCGTEKVQNVLKTLQNMRLISIERRLSLHGDAESNLYTIMDLSHLIGVSPSDTQVYLPAPHGVSPSATEGYSLKDPQLKDKDNIKPPVANATSPPGETRRRKTYFPLDEDKQTALKAKVIDQALLDWYRLAGLAKVLVTPDLDAQWGLFANKALAKGYQYLDWHRAFQNWLTSEYQPRHSPVTSHDRPYVDQDGYQRSSSGNRLAY